MIKHGILKKKYPRFVYESYSYAIDKRNLKIAFAFRIEPDISFSPTLIIKNIKGNINRKILDNLIFHLGLIEMISYWKATCSSEIQIRCGKLNKEQVKWWQDLIAKGMAEFFYTNKIKPMKPKIITKGEKGMCLTKKIRDRILIPMGGGKDSLVTLEMLKGTAFYLNPKRILNRNSIIAERKIDKGLLELNKKEFLNGHTPFSAYLAFLSVLIGVIFDYKYLVFSNERSANEGNVFGKNINHQYSKSINFENKFRKYSKKYLAKDIEYFSFLRPLYELQISSIFSRYEKFFSSFLSCNKGKTWCCQCPKCLFVFTCLYPFIGKRKILEIFGKNLFENKKLLPLMLGLIKRSKVKPFECVGTKEESLLAFYLSSQKERFNKKPFLLRYFDKNISSKIQVSKILNSWNRKNNLPKKFRKLSPFIR